MISPIYRKPSQLGMNSAPRLKYIPIIHLTGLRIFGLAENEHVLMCMENGCSNTGSEEGFKCI